MFEQKFEFTVYDSDANEKEKLVASYRDAGQARNKAGQLAKQNGGPVDLAYLSPDASWDDKYITTAAPSEFHTSGYRFERLV